jgi:AraC-like DNA-binding protein
MDLNKIEIKDPEDYHAGLEFDQRPVSRSVLLFLRKSRRTLQQKHIANRMHHRYVLVNVIETGGMISLDGSTLRIDPGESLLILPYQFHHFLETDSEDIRWMFTTFELEQGGTLLRSLKHRVSHLVPEEVKLLSELVSAWQADTESGRRAVLGRLDLLLLSYLSTSGFTGRVVPSQCESSWASQVEALVIRSVEENWTFEEVAHQMGISVRHLRTRFETAIGVSLQAYRSNFQLHRAFTMVREHGLSMGEVAEHCGFQSQSVFTRFIKRHTGLTPTQLRAELSRRR